MVVAELFAAQAWAAAAVAVGEDVAALIAFRFVDDRVDDCLHEAPPHGGTCCAKSSKEAA